MNETPRIPRIPYVGEGSDGARRSAEIDRTEAEQYTPGDGNYERCIASAERWDRQAESLAEAEEKARTPARQIEALRRKLTGEGVCASRKRDRWGTLHPCVRPTDHAEYHESSDGLMWADTPWRYRRVPVAAERYLGKTGAIRELVEVVPREELSGLEFAPCLIRLRPGGQPTSIFPGQWVVMYSNGDVEIADDDRFHARVGQATEVTALQGGAS